jgi:hypothetical protein
VPSRKDLSITPCFIRVFHFICRALGLAIAAIHRKYRIRQEHLPDSIDVQQWDILKDKIVNSTELLEAAEIVGQLKPFHFPIAFPEVFLRERSGFDVIIGNPPWQEATIEEDAFWARHSPGLRGLPQREQEATKSQLREDRSDLFRLYEQELAETAAMRRALTSGAFPGMGTGDPDVYKAFCWRFLNLVSSEGGRMGVVLPRSALAVKGSTPFRMEILEKAESIDITMLVNNRRWFFEDVHPQHPKSPQY